MAAAFITECRQRSLFLDAQSRSGLNYDQVQQGQANALLASVHNIGNISLVDASDITEAVNAGPWSGAQKLAIAAAIGDIVAGGPRGSKGSRKTQKISPFRCFSLRRIIAS